MHSCYETAGVQDALDLEKVMEVYYSGSLEVNDDEYRFV